MVRLLAIYACKVHHGCCAASIVVSTKEYSVTTHAKVLIVRSEDNHGVATSRQIATHILASVT